MKSAFSLACIALVGANALSISQNDAKKDIALPADLPEQDEGVMMTYIGFEFEGTDLADNFASLSNEQQNEVRLQVKDLIKEFWTDAGEPDAPELDDDMEDNDEEDDQALCQVDAEADAEAGADAEHCCGWRRPCCYRRYRRCCRPCCRPRCCRPCCGW